MVKPYRSDGSVQPLPPELLSDEPVYNVERILDHEVRKEGRRSVTYYLVKWEGYGSEHNSWEPEKNFLNRLAIDEYLATLPK